MKKFLFNITVVLVFMVAHSAHALTITPTNDANTLVNAILGSGVTVTSSSFTGASVSAGLFSGGSSAIGINSGIILTTGEAALAVGPNSSNSAGRNNSLGGSSALESIIPGTLDATILDIDFITTTGNLFFNFVFASEEYNEYVGTQFNDVFAFFLNGVNIALLPNSTPVSINNVNNGANSAFYIDNNSGTFDTQYDGFTTVLTAQALNLGIGPNRISIQIADVSDRILDSAVFIQGGTFSGSNPVVPEPNSILLVGTGLVGLAGMLRRRRQ